MKSFWTLAPFCILASQTALAKDGVQIQVTGLDYTWTSTEVKPETGTARESTEAVLRTAPLGLSLAADYEDFRTEIELEGASADSGTLRQFFNVNPMFGIGLALVARTQWDTAENAAGTTETSNLTNMSLAVGPSARLDMKINSDMQMEGVVDLVYINQTKKGRDSSLTDYDTKSDGFAFSLSGGMAIEVIKNMALVPSLALGYSSLTDKDDTELNRMSISVTPLAVRAIF